MEGTLVPEVAGELPTHQVAAFRLFPTGEPVRRLEVEATVIGADGRSSETLLRSDDRGEVVLPPGSIRRATATSAPELEVIPRLQRETDYGKDELVFWCFKTASLRGVVTLSPVGSKPVATEVHWGLIGADALGEPAAPGRSMGRYSWLRQRRLAVGKPILTDEVGKFSLSCPVAEGLFLLAKCPGYYSVAIAVPSTALERGDPVEVTLRRAAILSGVVRARGGEPIPGAAVQVLVMQTHDAMPGSLWALHRLSGLGGGASGVAGRGFQVQQRQQVLTDAAGAYRLSMHMEGQVWLALWPPGFDYFRLPIGQVDADKVVHVSLEPHGDGDRVAFTLDSRPIGGWSVTLANITSQPEVGIVETLDGGSSLARRLLVDGNVYVVVAAEPETGSGKSVTKGMVYRGESQVELSSLPEVDRIPR
jgi:hypothetical protein